MQFLVLDLVHFDSEPAYIGTVPLTTMATEWSYARRFSDAAN